MQALCIKTIVHQEIPFYWPEYFFPTNVSVTGHCMLVPGGRLTCHHRAWHDTWGFREWLQWLRWPSWSLWHLQHKYNLAPHCSNVMTILHFKASLRLQLHHLNSCVHKWELWLVPASLTNDKWHICASVNLSITCSDQANIWTNAGLSLIGSLGTNVECGYTCEYTEHWIVFIRGNSCKELPKNTNFCY